MSRLTRAAAVVCAVVVGVSLAGCSSDSASGPVIPEVTKELPEAWDPAAVKELADLAAQLAAARGGMCADFSDMPMEQYRNALVSLQTATSIPGAIGSCTVSAESDEIFELTAFADKKARDAFVEERRSIICGRKQARLVKLPGLRFVLGPNWTIQTDNQTTALDVAATLGGTYRMARCDGIGNGDWDADALRRIHEVTARMTAAGIPCVLDVTGRDRMRLQPHYQQVGLPGAIGTCTARFSVGSALVPVVGFAPGTESAEDFLPEEQAYRCTTLPSDTIVRGDGWAAFVPEPVAQELADATGGRVDPRTCPTSATTTTTTAA
jgi:hypothetical protein